MNAVNRPISALLEIEENIRRACSFAELGFVAVNDCFVLAPYRQAALFVKGRGVEAVSGVSQIERNAPYIRWLTRMFGRSECAEPIVSGIEGAEEADREAWREWLPPNALWVPVRTPAGERLGTLLFARDEPWGDTDIALLFRAADMCGFAWNAHRKSGRARRWGSMGRIRRWWPVIAFGAVIAAMLLPVRLSVLAPADIVPRDPAVIRSPIDGVVAEVSVRPNAPVVSGQVLMTMDRTAVSGRLEIARKELATTRAELDRATQRAFAEVEAKALVAVLKARIEEHEAEVDRLQEEFARCRIRAPRSGVAVMNDPSDWIGRPVAVGEKLMVVAEADDVAVDAWLAPDDVIDLPDDAAMTVFLNTAPLSPRRAEVGYVAYEASARPDGTLAYRVRARFADGEDRPRLGLKATARLDGRKVTVFYWLFRRPIATLRGLAGI